MFWISLVKMFSGICHRKDVLVQCRALTLLDHQLRLGNALCALAGVRTPAWPTRHILGEGDPPWHFELSCPATAGAAGLTTVLSASVFTRPTSEWLDSS